MLTLLAESQSAMGAVRLFPENPLHISTIRDFIVCSVCRLRQFEPVNGKCRRCYHSLGITYLEIFPSNPLMRIDSQSPLAMRLEVGEPIRRLRSRRGMTQAALASLTGIHRTWLSRSEHGQVMSSVFALM